MTIGNRHVAVEFHSDGTATYWLGVTRLNGASERGAIRLPPQAMIELGQTLEKIGRAVSAADKNAMAALALEINGPQPKEVASAGA